MGARSDELDVARLADLGEVGAFRQESVAWMNGVGAGDLGGTDDRGHVQITVGAAGGADAHVLVRKPDVQRVLVGLGIDGDCLDPELAAGVDDSQSDLAAVRDQDFFEHYLCLCRIYAGLKSCATPAVVAQVFRPARYRVRIANSRSPYCTGCPLST